MSRQPNRKNAPSKTVIMEHWKDWLEEQEIDWNEPVCWACKAPDWWAESWSDSSLERAHIVAHSLGGDDSDPDNFVLLCPSCHKEAPTTACREDVLTWVTHQENYLNRFARELQKNLSIFVPHDQRQEFEEWASEQNLLQTLKDAHARQEITVHSNHVPVSSVVSLLYRKWKDTTA